MSRKITKSDDGVVSASVAIDPEFAKMQNSLRDPEIIDSTNQDISDYEQKMRQLEEMANIFSDEDDDASLLGVSVPDAGLPEVGLPEAGMGDDVLQGFADEAPSDSLSDEDHATDDLGAEDLDPEALDPETFADEAVAYPLEVEDAEQGPEDHAEADAAAALVEWDLAVTDARLAGEEEATLPLLNDELEQEEAAEEFWRNTDDEHFEAADVQDAAEDLFGGEPEAASGQVPFQTPVEAPDAELHAQLDADFAEGIEDDFARAPGEFPVLGAEAILRNAVASGMVIRDQAEMIDPEDQGLDLASELDPHIPADFPEDTGDAGWDVEDPAPEHSFGSSVTYLGVVDEIEGRDEDINLDDVGDSFEDRVAEAQEATDAEWGHFDLEGHEPGTIDEEAMNDAREEVLLDDGQISAEMTEDEVAGDNVSAAEDAAQPKKKGGVLKMALIGAVVMATAGFGAYTFMAPPAPHSPALVEATSPATPQTTVELVGVTPDLNTQVPSELQPSDVVIIGPEADPVLENAAGELADLRMLADAGQTTDPTTQAETEEDPLEAIARGNDANSDGELSDLFLDFPPEEPEAAPEPEVVIATASLADFEALAASMATMSENVDGLYDAIELRDAQILELRAAMDEMSDRAVRAENLALAQNQVLVRFVSVEEKVDMAEHLIVDLSRRIAQVEVSDPADRAAVDQYQARVNERLDALTRDVGLVARMAINGSPQGITGARTAATPNYDRAAATMVSPVAAPENVPADVAVGDFVNGYGAVLEIFATTDGGRLVVMENGTVVLN